MAIHCLSPPTELIGGPQVAPSLVDLHIESGLSGKYLRRYQHQADRDGHQALVHRSPSHFVGTDWHGNSVAPMEIDLFLIHVKTDASLTDSCAPASHQPATDTIRSI